MSTELLEALRVVMVALVGILITFLFTKYKDPLRRIKELSKSPIVSILASAAVLLSEAYWSEYDGAMQYEKACEWLAGRLSVPVDQVREIVQAAYEALKEILGENWGALKFSLAPKVKPGKRG